MTNGVEALEKGGFTFQLVRDPSDLPAIILDKMVEPRYYTPTGLVEFHMPILFKKNTAGDLSFSKSDFSYYYQHLINTTGLTSIKVEYIKNETYQVEDKWLCTEYGSGNNSAVCMEGYQTYKDDWRLPWANVPSNIIVKSNKWYMIDIIGYADASLDFWAVDLVPKFKTISLNEYAWYNQSYDYKRRVDVDSTVTTDNQVLVNVSIDTATLIAASKLDSACHGLRVVAANESTLLNFDWEGYGSSVYGCNQSNTIIWVQHNVLTDNSSYFWLYYSDLAGNALGNTTATYDSDYVAVFHLGEGSGSTTYDSVNKVAGTITGSRWINQVNDGSVESVGHSLEFDGNDLVNFGDNFDITGGALTMELWTQKPNLASGTYDPFGKHDGARDSYWFLIGGNGVGGGDQLSNCIVHGNDAWSSYESTNLGWNWMGCTYNSSYVDHYVNGTFTNSAASGTDPINDASVFYIGYEPQYGTDYVGNITEIRISDSVRSADFLKLSYDVINNGNQLVTLGAEQTAGHFVWSNNQSYFPPAYDPSDSSDFETEWNSSASSNGYNVSLWYSNFSGSWVSYPTSRSGNISYINITLPATTFTWYLWANDSNANTNQTDNYTHTIAQASQSCTIINNESTTEIYPTAVNISATCEYGSVNMYRWDQDTGVEGAVSNPNAWLPPSNTTRGYRYFNYTANTTGNQNYSAASDTYDLRYEPASSNIQEYLNGQLNTNININTGDALNVTVIGNGTVFIYLDGVQVNSSGGAGDFDTLTTYYNTTLTTGTYYLSSNSTGNAQNISSTSGVNYSVTVGATLTVRAFEENTGTQLTFNITLRNDTFTNTEYNQLTFSANSTNTPYGLVTIDYWTLSHPQRSYYTSLTNTSNETIDLFLYGTGATGQYVSFYVKNYLLQPVTTARIYAERLINASYVVVAERNTDAAGVATIYLDWTTQYRIIAEDRDGTYDNVTITITPTLTGYEIYMGDAPTVNYSSNFEDLYFTIYPLGYVLSNNSAQDFHFNLTSVNSTLFYMGFNLTYANNTVIFSNNTTTTTEVDILTTFNLSDYPDTTLRGYYWFRKSGYGVFWINKTYIVYPSVNTTYSNLTVWGIADDIALGSLNISEGVFLFISIICMMIAGGFGMSFAGEKGGLVGIGVLGIFTFLGTNIYSGYFLGWSIFLLTALTLGAWYWIRGVF